MELLLANDKPNNKARSEAGVSNLVCELADVFLFLCRPDRALFDRNLIVRLARAQMLEFRALLFVLEYPTQRRKLQPLARFQMDGDRLNDIGPNTGLPGPQA